MGQVHLYSELAFIERFADEGALLGEHGYCLATFQAALGCLRSLTWREIEDATRDRAEMEEADRRSAQVSASQPPSPGTPVPTGEAAGASPATSSATTPLRKAVHALVALQRSGSQSRLGRKLPAMPRFSASGGTPTKSPSRSSAAEQRNAHPRPFARCRRRVYRDDVDWMANWEGMQ